eukprot:CAMPEP_0175845576 /NCGR_PEP_ID=MMETSP0107_2-20121207/22300_1 /TAXON_ID=195067 ORGANISM="Goniomonas pacifica, Strain CCMP1869" /NCGR_SAMPLE_ID=MMETSP0107_2 /ASSEMBLY_ACC=CAM_ASM_000203 /LENGTH=459 /DNA_ID=CAMNT_0017160147 /DNA_START=42 /DNA_END=1421 /DNA_ORIENTATION=+
MAAADDDAVRAADEDAMHFEDMNPDVLELLDEMKHDEEEEAQRVAQEKQAKGGWLSAGGSMAKKMGGYGVAGVKKLVGGSARLAWSTTKWAWGKASGSGTPKLSKEEQEQLDEMMARIMATRREDAAQEGGIRCTDHKIIREQRSIVTEVIKQMGRNILKGKDLLYVTFPVRCSQPRSVLQIICNQSSYSPNFLPKAAGEKDPLERFKLVVAYYLAGVHCSTGEWFKPLNPVLGETYQACLDDGTSIFMEQTSHHPPVTSWQVFGPQREFSFYGHVQYAASFGYNKLRVTHSGRRVLEFADGGKICFTNPSDVFSNVFWGEPRHETLGTVTLSDEANGLSCDLEFAPDPQLPSDFVVGDIVKAPASEGEEPEVVASVEASWLGFVDIDKKRYWDIHSFERHPPQPAENPLPSDSRFRRDLILLKEGDLEAAQVAKIEIEERQRLDRRLRAATQAVTQQS